MNEDSRRIERAIILFSPAELALVDRYVKAHATDVSTPARSTVLREDILRIAKEWDESQGQ